MNVTQALNEWLLPPLSAAMLYILLGCGKSATTSSTTSKIGPPASGQSPWRLVWAEEFDGLAGTALDTASWMYDVGTNYPTLGPICNLK